MATDGGTREPMSELMDPSMIEVSYALWTWDAEIVGSSVFCNGRDTLDVVRLIPGGSEEMKLMVQGLRRRRP